MIFYESPHRIAKLLAEIEVVIGNRPAALCRELTKKFETFNRGTLSELITYYSEEPVKGEIVLILEGCHEDIEEAEEGFLHLTVQERYEMLLDQGLDRKEAMKTIAKERNLKKTDVYGILNK